MKATQLRQHNLSVLARSSRDEINNAWDRSCIHPTYEFLKNPEIGMVMVKAQSGGTGNPFNMGEMTVTRCVIQLNTGEIGYGYTQGRDKVKSELIALIDACHQVTEWSEIINSEIISELSSQLINQHKSAQEKTDSSKVNFFTMVRGE